MPDFDFGFEQLLADDVVATTPQDGRPVASTGGARSQFMAGFAAMVVAASVVVGVGGAVGVEEVVRGRSARAHPAATEKRSAQASAVRRIHAKAVSRPHGLEVMPSFSGTGPDGTDATIPDGLHEVVGA